MKHLMPLLALCSAARSALTDIPIIFESTLGPSTIVPKSPTVASGAAFTITVIPTQVIAGDATLTRNAPGTLVGGTPVSFGSTALVIGASTIPFDASGLAPIYIVAGQTVAAGPAGVAIAGSTISNNGPGVTISGTAVSLGSFGLVINDASTFTIPTVQPLQSVFAVGGQSVTEQYGRIIFPSTQPLTNVSIAATGTAAGPVPTGSAKPFMGAAVGTVNNPVMMVVELCTLLCIFFLLVPWG